MMRTLRDFFPIGAGIFSNCTRLGPRSAGEHRTAAAIARRGPARSTRRAHRALSRSAAGASARWRPTYPLEVVQADRWAKANKSLKGDQLTAALDKQDWDASVKQLVSTPTVLAMMNDKLDWTQAAWRRRAGATGRRDGCHSATARQGTSQRQARDDQAAEGDGHAGPGQARSSRSSRHRPRSSTCLITIRRWSMAIGHIPLIRLIIFRHRLAGLSAARSPQGLPGARPMPSAMKSGTTSTGVTAISMSTSIGT